MNLPRSRVARYLIAAVAVLVAGFAAWSVWPTPRVDMASYAPESALAFVEVDSLPDLAQGLSGSDAWHRLAGPLGLSGKLDYAGAAGLLGRFGVGSDQARALSRAQFAAVVTGVEAGAEPGADGGEGGATVVIKPRFAFVVKTHASASIAREFAETRMPEFARRAYGDGATVEQTQYGGGPVSIAHAAEPNRQIVWAVRDDLLVVGNSLESVQAVLDASSKRAPALSTNFYLQHLRDAVSADSGVVFAYVSQAGVAKLVGIGPGVVAGTITADPDKMASVSRVFASVSEGTVQAVGYAGTFDGGRFVDRYYTMLTPRVADAIAQQVRPATGDPAVLGLVPPGVAEVTLVRVERPGETFDALLTALSSHVDASVSATLTQVAVETRRAYGVEPGEEVAPAIGDEVAFVDFGEGQSVVTVFAVRDQVRLLPAVERYLRKDGARISTDTRGGYDVLKSSAADERAAAFVGGYLVLGTPYQIARVIEARSRGERGPLAEALQSGSRSVIATERQDARPTAELMLALSGALGATDGDPALLDRPDVHDALEGLPPSVSLTEVREGGLFVETRSAVGNLTYLTAFL